MAVHELRLHLNSRQIGVAVLHQMYRTRRYRERVERCALRRAA
ncbi:hypothetical protein [Hymenobacter siberiensis]|nr:hypothetical protein [Hymenobacter siberiensis]